MAQARDPRNRNGDTDDRSIKFLTTDADQALARAMYRDVGMFRQVLNEGMKAKLTPGQLLIACFEAAVNAEAFIIQPKAGVATGGLKTNAQDRNGDVVTLNQLSIAFLPPAGMVTNATKFLDAKYTIETFAHHRAVLQSMVQEALCCIGPTFVLGVHGTNLNQQGFVSVYNLAVGLDDADYKGSWPRLKALSDLFDPNIFGRELSELVDSKSEIPISDQLESIVQDGLAEGARPHIVNMGGKAEKLLRFNNYHNQRRWYYKAMEEGSAKQSPQSNQSTSSSRTRRAVNAPADTMPENEDIPF